MTVLGAVLAVVVGAAGGAAGSAILTWGILAFSGELGETPSNIRRSRLAARLFATAGVGAALAAGGFVAGAYFDLLPGGLGWLWFAAVTLVSFIACVGLGMRQMERAEASNQ